MGMAAGRRKPVWPRRTLDKAAAHEAENWLLPARIATNRTEAGTMTHTLRHLDARYAARCSGGAQGRADS